MDGWTNNMPMVTPSPPPPPQFYVSWHRGVSSYIVEEIKRAARGVERLHALSHNVRVLIHVDPVVIDPLDRCCCYGLYQPKHYRIDLAGGMVRKFRQLGDTRSYALGELVKTFLHEFVHYEQHRDGKDLVERGVNRRAETLMRKIRSGESR